MAVVLLDGHVVLRQTPRLPALPASRNTLGPELLALPVLEDDLGFDPGRGREHEGEREGADPSHCRRLLEPMIPSPRAELAGFDPRRQVALGGPRLQDARPRFLGV